MSSFYANSIELQCENNGSMTPYEIFMLGNEAVKSAYRKSLITKKGDFELHEKHNYCYLIDRDQFKSEGNIDEESLKKERNRLAVAIHRAVKRYAHNPEMLNKEIIRVTTPKNGPVNGKRLKDMSPEELRDYNRKKAERSRRKYGARAYEKPNLKAKSPEELKAYRNDHRVAKHRRGPEGPKPV